MPGLQGAGRQNLQTDYEWGGTELQGEAAGAGDMYGVWEVTGKGFTGGAPLNQARRGEKGVGTGGRQGRRRKKDQGAQDGFS